MCAAVEQRRSRLRQNMENSKLFRRINVKWKNYETFFHGDKVYKYDLRSKYVLSILVRTRFVSAYVCNVLVACVRCD